MTGKPVCRATRSAVRCRVPVSSVWMDGSGIRCTAARSIRLMSRSRMIAPSILLSSRRPVAVNSTSISNPPVEMESTTLSWPRTSRAPVQPRRIRSRPSRNSVPGATAARVARIRASVLFLSGLGATVPESMRLSGGGTWPTRLLTDQSRFQTPVHPIVHSPVHMKSFSATRPDPRVNRGGQRDQPDGQRKVSSRQPVVNEFGFAVRSEEVALQSQQQEDHRGGQTAGRDVRGGDLLHRRTSRAIARTTGWRAAETRSMLRRRGR